jgi:Flp pilus assembly protein protease CpaA
MLNHIFGVLFMLCVLVAMLSDARRLIIPNWISIALAAGFPLYVLLGGATAPFASHLLVAVVVLFLVIPLFLLELFGGGDVKFLAAAAFWAGPAGILPLVSLMSIGGLVLALMILLARTATAYGWLGGETGLIWGRLAHWAREGVCPYGLAIGFASLAIIMPRFL